MEPEIMGESKIDKLDIATAGHEDVRGFDVAVDEATFVRGFESVRSPCKARSRTVSIGKARCPILLCSVWPSSNSMAINAWPSCSPMS